MSEPSHFEPRVEEQDEVEVVDAFPVLAPAGDLTAADQRPAPGLVRSGAALLPSVQAAAVAAGGFVAGAAFAGLMARHQRRSPALSKASGRRALARRTRTPTPGPEVLQVLSSRTMLVDVHLLGNPGAER